MLLCQREMQLHSGHDDASVQIIMRSLEGREYGVSSTLPVLPSFYLNNFTITLIYIGDNYSMTDSMLVNNENSVNGKRLDHSIGRLR